MRSWSGLLCAALAACNGSGVASLTDCTPACAPGEICQDATCIGGPDAGPPPTCDPSCPAWETCSGTTCVLSSGSCNTDADCPSAKPLCDTSHTCVAPALTAPSTLAYRAVIVTNQSYAPAFQ